MMAGLCCLLLLLPVFGSLVVVQQFGLPEEESRQTSEEERTSESPIAARSHSRRAGEEARLHSCVVGNRGVGNRGYSAGHSHGSPFTAIAGVEHQLRNGIGTPLRC
jgi:hypothetical protein